MWSMVYKSRGTFLSIISAAGEDLLRLVCFCLAVSGCLVLSVGITGVLGTVQAVTDAGGHVVRGANRVDSGP